MGELSLCEDRGREAGMARGRRVEHRGRRSVRAVHGVLQCALLVGEEGEERAPM